MILVIIGVVWLLVGIILNAAIVVFVNEKDPLVSTTIEFFAMLWPIGIIVALFTILFDLVLRGFKKLKEEKK